MPKRSITTTRASAGKASNTNNKRQRTKKSTTPFKNSGSTSSAPPQSSTMTSKHNNKMSAQDEQQLPAVAAAPEDRRQQQHHHRVSEVLSDVSSVDREILERRSRTNSEDCIPIPSHVTAKMSGPTSTAPFSPSTTARPVSSMGSGSGIFFEGRELPPTSPVPGMTTDADKQNDGRQAAMLIPTFFDTNKVIHAVDAALSITTSAVREQQQGAGGVYDLVPSSLRSRATAFTPLLPSPVLLNRDVASYLLKEQGHIDDDDDDQAGSVDGVDAASSTCKSESNKTTKTSNTTPSRKKKNEPVMLSLQLDQYAIHMKTQRLRTYLKKRAAERRAVRRAENERNSGRTDKDCKSSTGGTLSANRSAAASPIAGMAGAATAHQTGIKLQLPRPMSSYATINNPTTMRTTVPTSLPNTVSYDTATDTALEYYTPATTTANTTTATSYDHTTSSSLTESAPLSACSQDVLDAAVALTQCLTTRRAG